MKQGKYKLRDTFQKCEKQKQVRESISQKCEEQKQTRHGLSQNGDGLSYKCAA